MTNILAIDTSTEACSVALIFNNQVSSDFVISQRDHTKQILPMIDSLLKQANCSLSNIDAIAFAKGPGSFTGVRIGIGIAQGLALGLDKPLIAVSTLAVLAQGAHRIKGATKVIAAIDARMGEVYLGAYQITAPGNIQLIVEECVIKPERVSSYLAPFSFTENIAYYAGTGWSTYPNMLTGLKDGDCLLPKAEDMLIIAQQQYLDGNLIAVENVEATYLRNDVTWKKLPGR
ncbi:tRNA (adenosine(37)-N6)-threonylcarbamoyltransferase complex dimerization subunit type 1 TsaB [Orbus sturtevantii]|uniref:tRNA (adenosine(37)-N6)-threonylcarbamoyltransferase complex dimerization subunit type 1 TsaB n=1 Tax=Orbus sturtevantii TaxID=3074109 RepID=UPI00370D29F5